MSAPGGCGPLVSVVIPAHNRAGLLGRALSSALAQSWRELELLVIDDGSTDATADVAAAVDDPRIRLVRLPRRGGVGRARNEGIRRSRGEIVAFLDSDDEWLPGKLERQMACLRGRGAPDRTVVSCRFARHDDDRRRRAEPERPVGRHDAVGSVLRGRAPLSSTAMLSRRLLDAAGGIDESLPAFADYELWLRLAVGGAADFVELPEVLVIKHEHGQQMISRDPEAMRRGFERLDAKWQAILRERRGEAAYRRWRARLLATIQYVRIRQALERRDRREAWRHWFAMCRYAPLPWSRPYVAYGLGLAMLGLERYTALAHAKDAMARAMGRR